MRFRSMSLKEQNDLIESCFIEKDPLCSLYLEDALWLDRYASNLMKGINKIEQEKINALFRDVYVDSSDNHKEK